MNDQKWKKKRQNSLFTMLGLFTLYHESKQLVVCGGGTHALSSEWKRRTPNASALVIMAQNSPGLSLGIYEQPVNCLPSMETCSSPSISIHLCTSDSSGRRMVSLPSPTAF